MRSLGAEELDQLVATYAPIGERCKRKATRQRALWAGCAAAVAAAAKSFVTAHQDGSKLPNSIKIPSKAKGDVYQP